MNSPGFQRITLIPWKPPSFLVKTLTLKSSYFGKRPYAWNQIRTTFSGPSVSKILLSWKPRTPGHDILPVLHNPSNGWASNLCFTEEFEDIHFMINSLAHEFLNNLCSGVHPWSALGHKNMCVGIFVLFLFAMKRRPIAANIPGSIGTLLCCFLSDFFTYGYERLPDLWGLS